MIVRLGRRLGGGIAAKRMHRVVEILLLQGLRAGPRAASMAAGPRGLRRPPVPAPAVDRARFHAAASADWRGRNWKMDRSARSAAPVRPADRFRPWRARWLTAAIVVVVRGKRSVLVSISHRDDASPSGKPPTRPYKRTSRCQLIALTGPHVSAVSPAYRISSGAWTPRTARPDARTETTPWTKASRAFVISASLLIMKRK